MWASSAILRKVRVISHSIEKTYSEEYPFYFLISVSFAILFYEFKFVILSTYISYKFQKIYLFMKNLTFPPILLVPLVPPLAQACSLCPIQNSKFPQFKIINISRRKITPHSKNKKVQSFTIIV